MSVEIQNFDGEFTCKITNGEPELYTNESVYCRTNGCTFDNAK